MRCTRCAGKRVRRQQAARRRQGDEHETDSWDDDSDVHWSPYMYGYAHYYGWGVWGQDTWGHEHQPDAADFTEADAASLTDELGEGFDADVGGS